MKKTQNFQGWGAPRRNNPPSLDVEGHEMQLTRGGDSEYLMNNPASGNTSPNMSPRSKFYPRNPSPKQRPPLLHLVSSTSNRTPGDYSHDQQ